MKAVGRKAPRQSIKGDMKAVSNEEKKREIKQLRSINLRFLYERSHKQLDRS